MLGSVNLSPHGFFVTAAVEAARELGVFEGARRETRRFRRLMDVLGAAGALEAVPERVEVAREGWGRLAEIVRRDEPIEVEPATRRGYHEHLLRAGAEAARELVARMGPGPLVDLGGGAGAYARAFVEARAGESVTIVDEEAVIELAREALGEFGARVRFVVGDARSVTPGDAEVGGGEFGVALLSNVLHLHGEEAGRALCAAAARAVRPGGSVIVKEVRIDEDRRGPMAGLLFALNMAVYTRDGDVYEPSRMRAWLEAAGLVRVEEARLEADPDAIVLIARRPRSVAARMAEVVGEEAEVAAIAAELDGMVARAGGAFPAAMRQVLASGVAQERRDGEADRAATLVRHYAEYMPQQRAAQLAGEPGAPSARADATDLFHAPLDWARLPRMRAAIDRLVAVMTEAGVGDDARTRAIGAASGDELRARTPTLAALYRRTHYGGLMPLLYGNPLDVAHFERRAAALGLDAMGAIDRYFTAPVIHELCHFAPRRDALLPLHLDESVAGWLGVHVLPEFAYPAGDHDDAIFAAPLLSQIGMALARAFGVAPLVRAHAGAAPWEASLPPALLDAAVALGWADWRARRTVHFLSDTLDPAPWVALALAAGSGRSLVGSTLAELGALPVRDLTLPPDDAFDRRVVEDGLRAMCLWNEQVDGSFRTRTRVPDGAVTVDAEACTITAPRRGPVDTVGPRWWLPPAVAARLRAAGRARVDLRIDDVGRIPGMAAALCA